MIFQDPYSSLNPPHAHRVRPRGADPVLPARRRQARGGRGCGAAARGRRPGARHAARASRTPSPAASGSASSIARALGAAAHADRLRRADVVARRLGPGADPQPAEGPARRHRPLAAVHQPRPRRHPADVRPRGGDEGRKDRRGGRRRRRSSPRPRTPTPASCSRWCRHSTRSARRDRSRRIARQETRHGRHPHHQRHRRSRSIRDRRVIEDGAVAIEKRPDRRRRHDGRHHGVAHGRRRSSTPRARS